MKELQQQVEFIWEIDRLKSIYRQTMVASDNHRQENSAEHSWHISLMAQVLAPYAEHQIDINRVISMLLIHDIVEIDAGDTFAFAPQTDIKAAEENEISAMNRLFGLLPASQGERYKSLWLEFEKAESIDAVFAKSMDRILPFFQNIHNEGGSWAKHQISKNQVLKRNEMLKTSAPLLWQYVQENTDIAVDNGWLID